MRWSSVLFLLTTSCVTRATIPYDLSKVKIAKRPVHQRTLAILPLVDGRLPSEAPDRNGRFIYRGLEYRGTRLDLLSGDPMWRITEVVGQHLARTNHFERVLLVLSPKQAPEADLFLHGRVLRARGYVEANPPPKKSGRPPNERNTLSEVALTTLRIEDRKGRVLMESEVGWSSFEKRIVPEDKELDPWSILATSTRVALTRFTDELRGADLGGDHVVEERVVMPARSSTVARGLASLVDAAPRGWRVALSDVMSKPVGWKTEQRCSVARFEQRQTVRFNRFLGNYRPTVAVWSCPNTIALTYDAKAEFPAEYVGEIDDVRYFVHRLGKTNWPTAARDITTRLGVTPPKHRHTFELPAK